MSTEIQALADEQPAGGQRRRAEGPWTAATLLLLASAPVAFGVHQLANLFHEVVLDPAVAAQLNESARAAQLQLLGVGTASLLVIATLLAMSRRRKEKGLDAIATAVVRLRDGDLTATARTGDGARAGGILDEVGQNVSEVSTGMRA